MPQDPPVIPVDEELPMDWYNVELRRYQDDIGRGVNFVNESFACLFKQMHFTPRPGFPYISSWDERMQARGYIKRVEVEPEEMKTRRKIDALFYCVFYV